MAKVVAAILMFSVAVAGVRGLPVVNAEEMERSGRFACMGSMNYAVEVTFDWSSETHGDAYPEGAHFSPNVVASHSMFYNVWAPLGFSSAGVQEVAETGNPTQLVEELMDQYQRNVLSFSAEEGPASSNATVMTTVLVNGGHSFISSITMLAPSPDWFTGIQKVNTCNEETGEFHDMITGSLMVYDAGSDYGEDFTSPDMPVAMHELRAISSISETRFSGIPVGSYKIYKMEE